MCCLDYFRALVDCLNPWFNSSARNTFVPRPWGIVCSMGADGSKDSDSDDDSSDDDGLRDRKSRSKVVLPDFDGTVENWMSWHVACLAYFRRIRREDYLLDTATAPPVLDSLDDYKDYYLHRSASGTSSLVFDRSVHV